jgi:hypothetical protein
MAVRWKRGVPNPIGPATGIVPEFETDIGRLVGQVDIASRWKPAHRDWKSPVIEPTRHFARGNSAVPRPGTRNNTLPVNRAEPRIKRFLARIHRGGKDHRFVSMFPITNRSGALAQ